MTRFILAITILLPALTRGDDRFAGLDPYVAAAMRRWEVPGVALAIVKDGDLVLARGYGVCELGTSRQVTADTCFPIASCNKAFTAASIALLVDQGKLHWDDPVAKHLPGFELADPYLTSHVTLRDLLTHRTGLQRGDDVFSNPTNLSRQQFLARVKHLAPLAELRTKYIYSSAMYAVAGQAVEHVSGRNWDEYLAEQFFQPLNMRSTTVGAAGIDPARLALRHWRSDAGIVSRPADSRVLGESGGIFSTVNDMAHWVQLQLSLGQYAGRRLLSEKSVREMHAMQFSVPITTRPPDNIYAARFFGPGLGWNVLDYRGHKVVRHGGAWGASVTMIPEENLGVVVLSNIDIEGIAGMLSYDVLDAYLVGPHLAWDQTKWESTWLTHEGPGYPYRPRDEAKAKLEQARMLGTKPSHPLNHYAGVYHSNLYGDLVIAHRDGGLAATFDDYTTPASHWQDDSFYVRGPTRITYDWLLTFAPSAANQPASVTVKHVGWEKDEPDQVFLRIP